LQVNTGSLPATNLPFVNGAPGTTITALWLIA